ncbi:MAG: hypothetical protein ACLPWF_18790 [Bryobacteraceae bacterium]
MPCRLKLETTCIDADTVTVYDRSGGVAITGEVKLPYMADGISPFNESVVEDAIRKAIKVGSATATANMNFATNSGGSQMRVNSS